MVSPSRVTDTLARFPIARAGARFLYRRFVSGVDALVDGAVRLRARGARRPTRVRSVLHVSVLSHKPYMLSRIMRRLGLRSEYLAVHAETGWLQVGERGYDYNIPANLWTWIFRPLVHGHALLRIMGKYDVIHYHFGSLITSEERELRALKAMGKLLVFHFRGCDLRQGSVNLRLNPDLNCCQECDYPPNSCETELELRRIDLARRYGDLLFVTTPDLLDFLPEAEHIPFVSPVEVDLDAIEPVRGDPDVFRVVTSSNHDGVDGTPYVREAVKRLQAEGHAIELIEVRRTPYEEALAIYKGADLYVGKLRMGYYNNANIECMAMGIPCMSYIRDAYLDAIPDCPIINTRPDTVYARLKEYLGKQDELAKIGRAGVEFVRRHHDPATIATMLESKYNEALVSQ